MFHERLSIYEEATREIWRLLVICVNFKKF